jgi:hypothetical protein
MAERIRERGMASAPEPGAIVGTMAAGKGKQRLYVLPAQGLTVVRFGPLEGPRGYEDREFLQRLLRD